MSAQEEFDEFKRLYPNIPTMSDDRCYCDGCQVVYARDIVTNGNSGVCDCGCYTDYKK